MKRRLSLVLVIALAASCADPCANSVVQELASPDGVYTATAFVRDCGATTSYSPQVYLRRTGRAASSTGNVFVGNRSERVEISWASATELVVASDCEVVRHERSYEGVRVTFRALP